MKNQKIEKVVNPFIRIAGTREVPITIYWRF